MCARRRLALRRASFNSFQSKFTGRDGGIPVPLGTVRASVLGSTAAMPLSWDMASLGGNAPSGSSGVEALTQRLSLFSESTRPRFAYCTNVIIGGAFWDWIQYLKPVRGIN